MPFNIGGRTNLLFCFYWGLLAMVWVKALYPRLSALIEKIPPVLGKIATWLLVVLFTCDGIISGMAVLRYVERREYPTPSSALEVFMDYNYPDSFIEFVYPNMRIDHTLVAPRVSRE